ncbi:hypothetical protein PENSTE_c017G02158 [Penicillium steckii]|uniref:ASST-domain-containing protein n=1 Tax=Penicillium steckii TaxID=303698 RepID=A0A1V6SXH4_9EURO|nr:hypothetical protein PENSTE_c017G02158 [Penicillium steckii]
MVKWLFVIALTLGASAQSLFQFESDDYISYRTLPKHLITRWNITKYDASSLFPGYWFTAPYWQHGGDRDTNQWIPYQVGPHIFDQNGELVWSGSVEFNNLNVYDFRKIDLPDGTGQLKPHLAWMRWHKPYAMETDGGAAVYNNHYEPRKMISVPANEIDTHDFNVRYPPNVLQIQSRGEYIALDELGRPGTKQIITSNGFTETNLITGERVFEWRGNNKVKLNESYITLAEDLHPRDDYMHANAIDKNENGDYLLSARHTSTIYLISGKDGQIIWRLGGKNNDFEKDFDFYGQHDSRFISVNSTHMVISFFNNGAIDSDAREPTSSAMYVSLDLVARKATVLQRYLRPDKGVTDRRGNMQTLANGNVLICWSWDGYMSEYSHDGKLLMEAKFASDRHDTYRAYKFPWVGRPLYPPTLISEANGVNGSELTTMFHVSWNGATDIEYWRFYARNSTTGEKHEIGTIPKNGFETTFIARGYMDWVSAEALDASLESLGVTPDLRTKTPEYWDPMAPLPQPDNPELFTTEKSVPSGGYGKAMMISLFLVAFSLSFLAFIIFIYRRFLIRLLTLCFSKLFAGGYVRVWSEEPEDLERVDEMRSFKSNE